MACCLCTETVLKGIFLFGEHGKELNISAIITKHFWFELNESDNPGTVVCDSCWRKVRDFDEFYKQVEIAYHAMVDKYKPTETGLAFNNPPDYNSIKRKHNNSASNRGSYTDNECYVVELQKNHGLKEISDEEILPFENETPSTKSLRTRRLSEEQIRVPNQHSTTTNNTFLESVKIEPELDLFDNNLIIPDTVSSEELKSLHSADFKNLPNHQKLVENRNQFEATTKQRMELRSKKLMAPQLTRSYHKYKKKLGTITTQHVREFRERLQRQKMDEHVKELIRSRNASSNSKIKQRIRRKHNRTTWNWEEELAIVEIWKKYLPYMEGNRKNSYIYTKMTNEMCALGHLYTKAEIRHKIHNFTQRHKAETKLIEDSGGAPSSWIHYEKVHELFGLLNDSKIKFPAEQNLENSMDSDASGLVSPKQNSAIPIMEKEKVSPNSTISIMENETVSLSKNCVQKLAKSIHKPRKKSAFKRVTWTESDDLLIMELWKAKVPRMRCDNSNRIIYSEIAYDMCQRGCLFSKREVRNKIHNLTSKYRSVRNGTAPPFKYYEQIDEIIGPFEKSNAVETQESSIDFSDSDLVTREENSSESNTKTESESVQEFPMRRSKISINKSN